MFGSSRDGSGERLGGSKGDTTGAETPLLEDDESPAVWGD